MISVGIDVSKEKGLFVAVVNPFEMKEYRCQGLRHVKTDKTFVSRFLC